MNHEPVDWRSLDDLGALLPAPEELGAFIVISCLFACLMIAAGAAFLYYVPGPYLEALF